MVTIEHHKWPEISTNSVTSFFFASPLSSDVAGGGVEGDCPQVVVRVEAQGGRAEELPPGAGQQLPHG